jgi:hypothetical protein
MNIQSFCTASVLLALTISRPISHITATHPKLGQDVFCASNNKPIWIEQLKELRDALYRQDKEKAKTFIDFTELNKNGDLGGFFYGYDETNSKRFTVQDFEKHFGKLFSPWFIKCLLKLKTDVLHKTGRFETAELYDQPNKTTYRIIATHDKSNNTLALNFNSNTEFKDADGTILDGGEHSIIYIFAITQKGQLQLKRLLVAG